jgi:hypothetical protein
MSLLPNLSKLGCRCVPQPAISDRFEKVSDELFASGQKPLLEVTSGVFGINEAAICGICLSPLVMKPLPKGQVDDHGFNADDLLFQEEHVKTGDDVRVLWETKCKHLFHLACMQGVVKAEANRPGGPQCPFDRQVLGSDEVNEILGQAAEAGEGEQAAEAGKGDRVYNGRLVMVVASVCGRQVLPVVKRSPSGLMYLRRVN